MGASSGEFAFGCCNHVARHQRVTSECFARKEDAGQKAERGIEVALEGGLEPGDIHAKFVEEVLRHAAVKRFRRLERLAAAVAENEAPVEGELIALGMTTEIIVIVENKNTGARAHGTAIEPSRGQPADPGPDYEKIVGLFRGRVGNREMLAPARECM